MRVAGKLKIFFSNVRGGAANFYILPVRFVDPRQRVLVVMATTTFAIATAHSFILTVSHVLSSANPVLCNGTAAAVSVLFQYGLHTRILRFTRIARLKARSGGTLPRTVSA